MRVWPLLVLALLLSIVIGAAAGLYRTVSGGHQTWW